MKTSYWYARIETDADCYSVREKSKKRAKQMIKELSHHRFGPLVKVTVEGPSLFEILKEALGEGNLYAESSEYYRAIQAVKNRTIFIKAAK
jgi:hypothetical protein